METPQQSEMYTRRYPTAEELEGYTAAKIRHLIQVLEDDVTLLKEEHNMMSNYYNSFSAQKSCMTSISSVAASFDGQIGTADEIGSSHSLSKGRIAPATTGNASSNFSAAAGQTAGKCAVDNIVALSLADKQAAVLGEQTSLRLGRNEMRKNFEEEKEQLHAIMEEAQHRAKEMGLEIHNFAREVLEAHPETNPFTVSAFDASLDKIAKYFQDRPQTNLKVVKRLQDKCDLLQQQLNHKNKQIKQKNEAGDAFNMLDLDQLKIENSQFIDRIEQKNMELVDLKTTATRSIHTQNKHMDQLNLLINEQTRLKRDVKNQEDFQTKIEDEIAAARKCWETALRKNEALKQQHETIRVPKIEDYIAQKTELYELNKANENLKRKIEIAENEVAVMKQQLISFTKKHKGILEKEKKMKDQRIEKTEMARKAGITGEATMRSIVGAHTLRKKKKDL